MHSCGVTGKQILIGGLLLTSQFSYSTRARRAVFTSRVETLADRAEAAFLRRLHVCLLLSLFLSHDSAS